ncbi:MAG TPA: pseudomurein-binding repeat-containing protein [Methanobacterium sp.]|nr:pseudomurein-binding repeat-containing protein [Methanobacterium sp.]
MKKQKLLPVLLAVLMFLSMGAASAASTTFNTSSISTSASNVKTYVDTNHKLPNTVKVNTTTVNTTQFLYLLAQGVVNVNNSNTTKIPLKSVSKASSPSETVKTGTLTKTEYLKVATNIISYINKYGKAPNYATTSLGNLRYENVVYSLSKILDYYNTNNRLPSSVSIQKWSSITSTNITSGGIVNFTDTSKTTTTLIGSNSLGKVYKIGPFGNGTKKVAVIIGVHPQEGAAHLAMLNALKTLASKLNNVQIWVFKVMVTKDISDYSLSRAHGQDLANEYVVPKIDTSYKLALDCHGNRGLYKTNDFVFAPSSDKQSVSYANSIIKNTDYLKYNYVADGTSPKYVTIPIYQKGIPAVVFELYLNVNNYNFVLYNKCLEVVKGLNAIFA